MIDRLDPLPPLGGFIADMLAVDQDADHAAIAVMTISMPIELDVCNGGGKVFALSASPPTQQIETTILPVFHHLQVTLAADDWEETGLNEPGGEQSLGHERETANAGAID